MGDERIDVIATTVSGSIADWKKVERILPLFADHGFGDVKLHVVDSHTEARQAAREVVSSGGRLPISAGGSGTFRAVLEGCCDAKLPLDDIRLGFLRKGSADLIGKVLAMPDTIEEAIAVFANAIREDKCQPCDILSARSGEGPTLRFVGYGGAEIFGRIPHYTENRWMKWYKGIFSQLFGDLGPFTTGMLLSLGEKIIKAPFSGRRRWRILADGQVAATGSFQAIVIVNGYLGSELAFSDRSLGWGGFEAFALRNIGLLNLPRQALKARSGAIMKDPDRWGLQRIEARESMEFILEGGGAFPANIDGSTLHCRNALQVMRNGQIRLIAAQ